MDVQAVDLELLDLEVSDNRSPDRKPANGQGADGTGANGRCADRGRAKASRAKLHRGPLLAARTEPGKGPREGPTVVHECSSFAGREPGRHVGCQSLLLHYRLPPLASQDADARVVKQVGHVQDRCRGNQDATGQRRRTSTNAAIINPST
jgi:hypothetical protein